MLDIVKKRLSEMAIKNGSINIFNNDIESFLVEEKYDVIIAMGLIAHVQSVDNTILKFFNLLNADGVALVQLSDEKNIINKIRHLRKGNRSYKLNRINSLEFENQVLKVGFQIKKVISYGLMLPGVGKLSNKFMYRLTKWTYESNIPSFLLTEKIYFLTK